MRGSNDSAAVLPAVWLDLDVATGVHKSGALPPDREAALGLLDAVGVPPSCLVSSGGGLHVYWLIDEPWILRTAAERRAAAALLKAVEQTVARAAHEEGWSLDPCSDLARVLRLPGTLNHKTARDGGEPRPVTVEHLDDERYRLADFKELAAGRPRRGKRRRRAAKPAEPPDAEPPSGQPAEAEERPFQPADFRRVYEGCSFIRWCDEERMSVKNPEWYAMLTIVGRCHLPPRRGAERPARPLLDGGPHGVGGRELAHRMSRGYPTYTPQETDATLHNALTTTEARRCVKIGGKPELFAAHCGRCRVWGRIRNPLILGMPWFRYPENPPSVPPFPKGGSSVRADKAAGGKTRRSRAAERSATEPGGRRQGSSAPPLKKGELEGDSSGKAPIYLSHHEERVADEALAALVAREENLFQRGGTLVQVVAGDGERPYHRPSDPPAARAVGEARLRELLATHCELLSRQGTGSGAEWRPVHPRQWLVRALLGRFCWRGVRRLEGIVEGPMLRPDGTVFQTTGYDRTTGLYYAPAERLDPVPEKPTAEEVEAALKVLRETVCDFPFAGEAHFSGWLASLLTPLARYAFKGPAPMNLIDANIRGAGKTLLADVSNLIVTGRVAAHMAYLRDELELRKAITAIALKGRQVVLFDNVTGAFGSATLDLALTSTTWEDRLLGQSLDLELPLLVTWYVTGNNIVLQGDLGRRCLHIRLESPEESPEHRGDFKHPRLLEWIEGERRRLLPAALTLLAGYFAGGAPDQKLKPWGAYESWSGVVRSAIVWLGLPDPIATCEGLRTTADGELLASENLVAGLAELLPALGGAGTAGEILEELQGGRKDDRYETLRSAVEELFPRLKRGELPAPVQLGRRLGSLRGRNFGGRAIEGKRSKRGVVWTLKGLPVAGELPLSPPPEPLSPSPLRRRVTERRTDDV